MFYFYEVVNKLALNACTSTSQIILQNYARMTGFMLGSV